MPTQSLVLRGEIGRRLTIAEMDGNFTYLESLVGAEQFREFLRYYINANFLTSITTIELRNTWEQWIEENYSAVETNQILAASNWEDWIFRSTLAPKPLDFSTQQAADAQALAEAYIALGGASSPSNYQDYFSFYSNLKVVFYDTLQAAGSQITLDLLAKIDADYDTTVDPDPEVKQRWLPMGLTLNYAPAYDAAHTWISSMGRCKYLTPVYVALENSGQHDLGVQWFNENINFYHPVAISTVSRDLNLS